MAITPSQWSHVLTIPESYTPSAATSGQTLVITEGVIAKLSAGDQVTFWSNVENGGGDVRICESSDGTNQLPVEVVSLDNVAKTCVIWTRKPTYAGTGSLYLFVGKAGETQPAVTDPFGRNAVWADYLFVHHLADSSSLINSQGDADWDVDSVTGTLTTSSESPFSSTSLDFNGSSFARIVNNVGIADLSTDPRTVQVWARPSSLPNDEMGILLRDVNSNGGFKFYFDNSETASGDSDTFILNSDSTSDRVTSTGNNSAVVNAWQMIHVVNQRDVVQNAYYNGSLVDTANGTPMSTFQGDDQLIGGTSGYVSSEWQGQLAELRVAKSLLTGDYIATEYSNQNNPASFYGTPTLASTSGGGTATLDANVTLPSLTATGTASATLPQATLSASINLTQLSATGSASATLPNPQLSANVTLSSLTAAGSVSATLPQPTLSANVTLPTITVSGNASATLPGFNLSGNITLPVITATGAAQATLPQPTLTASVTLPTFTVTGSATATEPSFTLSGNVTLQPFTVTGAASATLPQPTLSGNITLPSIQVSGFLVGGEIVITIDASTNINEPTLSTNITEPTLSTNISE